MPTRLSRYGQGHCREFAASGVQLNWRCTLERCRWQSPPDDRWHNYEQSSVIVEMSDDAADGCEAPGGAVDNGVCNTCSAAAVSACSLMTCDANFFDTNGDATDGCKAPGGAVDNGACNTGSAAAVGARSSVTCNANLFRHQGRCR